MDVCGDLQRCLADTLAGGLDFLVAPLAHPRHRRPSAAAAASRDPSAPAPAPFARSDLLLNSAQWSSQVVGKTSPWIDADSPSAPYRADSEAALRQELGWAAHLSLHAVLLPPPRLGAANYARIVCQFLGALSHTALWVRVPLVDPAVEAAEAAAATMDPRRRGRVRGARSAPPPRSRVARVRRRRVHPTPRSRPVRGVGRAQGRVRGPPAARGVPPRGRVSAGRRRAGAVDRRTGPRDRRRRGRVHHEQARVSRFTQAAPSVPDVDVAAERAGGATRDGRGRGRGIIGRIGRIRFGRPARAHARGGGGASRGPRRMELDSAPVGVPRLPVPQDPGRDGAGARGGWVQGLPSGAAPAADGQPGERHVRDVRKGRVQVRVLRGGGLGVPQGPGRRRGRGGWEGDGAHGGGRGPRAPRPRVPRGVQTVRPVA